MNKHLKTILLATTFCFVFFPAVFSLFAMEIHVAPTGNDQNSGAANSPLQTLEKARQVARQARQEKAEQPITIRLHPGIYMLRQTVAFTAEDSGTSDFPLVITGEVDPKNPYARVHLVGGVVVPDWKKSTFNGCNDVFEADLAPLGMTQKFRQLYLDGTRQIWARYPNFDPALPYSGGWAYVEGKRPPMYTDIEGEPHDAVVLRQQDAHAWSRPNEGEVCIFPRYNWWNRIEKIKEYDPQTRIITLAQKMQYAARPEDRFAIFGMREELDAPGEWYQDLENQKLYFIPPQGVDLTKSVVTLPTVGYSLLFNKVSHVTLQNLEFSTAEEGAVRFSDCEHCVLEKSFVHDLGYFAGGGVSLRGGKNCTVQGCDIWNIGGHGVEVHAGDPVAMDRCNHLVDNCYIHHVGQFNRHGLGIMVGGAGTRLSHNLIHDTPRCGIFHGGVLHLLEYNRIRHCNTEMEDTGCTYGGGWTGGWTTIRYNHCTDSIGFNNHGEFFVFAWGIYLDESGCGYDVYGNIVERCQIGAMHLHNARENHITNNIFANNAGPHGKTRQLSLQGWDDNPNNVFLKDRQPKMLKEYNRLLTNPEWQKMRGMHISPENPFLPDGTVMRGNRIERNIFYYPEQSESTYVTAINCNLQANIFDENIVWNGGKVPVHTGRTETGKVVADLSAMIPHVPFKEADADARKNPNQTVAAGWSWYHKTFPEMKSEIVTLDEGTPFFKMEGAYNPDLPYIKNSCIKSENFALEPGKDYRLTFDLIQQDRDGDMTVRLVTENKGLWKPFGQRSFRTQDGQQMTCHTTFHYPAQGEPDYDERLGQVNIQFQFMSSKGTAQIGNFRLEETSPVSEWEAWQMAGADVHSIIADPIFVDAKTGDFRLKPESPALKLGFEQIPIEKIGPYDDSKRITWPILEANGVRENPQWLTAVPISQ